MKKSFLMLLLVAVFSLVACDNNPNNNGGNDVPPPSEEVVFINNLIEQSKDFDAATLAQALPGVWMIDSEYMYDEGWQNIKDIVWFNGEYFWDGGYDSKVYTFTADGKGEYYLKGGCQEITELTYKFDWSYDADSRSLIMVGNGYCPQPKVSGFNAEYIVLDRVSNTNQYIREVYKRVFYN